VSAEREPTVRAAFFGGSVLAGGNGVGIRYSNRELDPLWGAGLRFLLAALLFFGVVAALRLRLPRGRAPRSTAGCSSGDVRARALVELHAGFGQILLALVPLLTLLLAVMQGQERFRLAAVGGSLLALVGVEIMSQAPSRPRCPCCRCSLRWGVRSASRRLRSSCAGCRLCTP